MSRVDEAFASFPAIDVSNVSRWPLFVVLGVSAAGVGVAAVLRSPLVSTVAYVVLLLAGCGLLFFHRRRAIAATRRAGGSGYLAILGVERFAIGALALACLANGLVIAFEVASWDLGF